MKNIINYLETYECLPKNTPVEVHYNKWLSQFDECYRSSITKTLSHLFGKSFLTKDVLNQSLSMAVVDDLITGKNPIKYWKDTYILDCQKNGSSQKVAKALMINELTIKQYEFCNNLGLAKRFVYVDDFSFSYGRVKQDLAVISELYPQMTVDVITPTAHEYNYYSFTRNMGEKFDLNLNVYFEKSRMIENRKTYRNVSNVFWPHKSSLANEEFKAVITEYNYDIEGLRTEHIATDFFPDVQARMLTEEAFLIYGARILENVKDKKYFKPLGIGMYDDSLGFGASVFAYRNCPNTAPLVFWWGDYRDVESVALNWYPLMKRTGYGF